MDIKNKEKAELIGEKVILKPVELTDYQAIYENIQDKKISLYLGSPYPYGQKEAQEFVQDAQEK